MLHGPWSLSALDLQRCREKRREGLCYRPKLIILRVHLDSDHVEALTIKATAVFHGTLDSNIDRTGRGTVLIDDGWQSSAYAELDLTWPVTPSVMPQAASRIDSSRTDTDSSRLPRPLLFSASKRLNDGTSF